MHSDGGEFMYYGAKAKQKKTVAKEEFYTNRKILGVAINVIS